MKINMHKSKEAVKKEKKEKQEERDRAQRKKCRVQSPECFHYTISLKRCLGSFPHAQVGRYQSMASQTENQSVNSVGRAVLRTTSCLNPTVSAILCGIGSQILIGSGWPVDVLVSTFAPTFLWNRSVHGFATTANPLWMD